METADNPLSDLNRAAFDAALGFSVDWKADLAELLRSGQEISPSVREALADALEGKSFTRVAFKLEGHERLARWHASLQERRAWRDHGRRVAELIREDGAALEVQFENAAEKLGTTESKSKKAYYYFKRCQSWMQSASQDGVAYGSMPSEALATEFDIASIAQKTINPKPMNGPTFDEFYTDIIDRLEAALSETHFVGSKRAAALNVLFWIGRMPFRYD